MAHSYGSTKKEGDSNAVRLLQDKVENVQGVMKSNIQSVIERGEKVDQLEETSSKLQTGAKYFQKGSEQMKSQLKMGYYKRIIILIVIIVAIILVVLGIIGAVVGTQVKK